MFRIDSYKQGVNLSHKGWSKMVDQTNEMVQKQGALYIDADNYTSEGREKGLGEILERIPKGIRVNGAMIQLFAIKDEQGIVHLDRKRNYQKHPLFLIPQKYKDQVWLNNVIQDYHAEVDYIPNHQKIYSFNTDVNVKEDGWIEDPIMVIDNQIKTNQETVKLLNLPMEGQVDRVFVREGAFCAYRIVERLKPELSEIKDKIVHGELNHAYSLIRLSAGLGTDPEDIEKAVRKLVRINLA